MKNTVFKLLVVFSISSFNYGQSILHPDKFGIGFHYDYSQILTSSASINSVTFLISPEGYLDFSLSISGGERFSSNDSQISGGIILNINNNIKNLAVPSISAAYISSEEFSAFGLAFGLNVISHRGESFSVIPQFGAGLVILVDETGSSTRNHLLYRRNSNRADVSFGLSFSICIAGYLDDVIIISAVPGISYNSSGTVFTVTTGLTFTSL